MPTAYLPMSETLGTGAFAGADAVPAGALTLAAAVSSPAASVTAANRARQRRDARASFIVSLRSSGRSRRLLLERRDAGLIGIPAQPLERGPVALQVAVEEIERNVRHRRRRWVGRTTVRRRVRAAHEREKELWRSRVRERFHAALIGQRPVGVAVLGEQRRRDAGEELRRVTRDARHRRRRLDALVDTARVVDESVRRDRTE